MGYGSDKIYTQWSIRSLVQWKEFFQSTGEELFHPTGVLWLAKDGDRNVAASLETLSKAGVKAEKLALQDMEKRFPQIAVEDLAWGLYEPDSGVLMARRAVQAVVREATKLGADYCQGAVQTPTGSGQVHSVATLNGETLQAGALVFACGAWLPKVFPDLLGPRIFPTRQEVFYFGVPAGAASFRPPAFPVWMTMGEVYGLPDLENRGAKIACDRHGPAIDPDTAERTPSAESLAEMRAYLGRRFPALRNAPLLESRVCQYENTSNGDFLIDRHPDFSNVWLVGGGSGHGFKHGPALGEYVTALILEGGPVEARFSLATKATLQNRAVY
jgi:glycine/D-amino acid oxidase-like deaminating enzyme